MCMDDRVERQQNRKTKCLTSLINELAYSIWPSARQNAYAHQCDPMVILFAIKSSIYGAGENELICCCADSVVSARYVAPLMSNWIKLLSDSHVWFWLISVVFVIPNRIPSHHKLFNVARIWKFRIKINLFNSLTFRLEVFFSLSLSLSNDLWNQRINNVICYDNHPPRLIQQPQWAKKKIV